MIRPSVTLPRRLSGKAWKDPVDAVAYVELALLVLKEELLAKVYKLEPKRRIR